jgi:hypothetical protein
MEGEGWDWDIFDYAPNKNKAAAMLKKELRKL